MSLSGIGNGIYNAGAAFCTGVKNFGTVAVSAIHSKVCSVAQKIFSSQSTPAVATTYVATAVVVGGVVYAIYSAIFGGAAPGAGANANNNNNNNGAAAGTAAVTSN